MTEDKSEIQQPAIWWKEKKLLAGIILVVLSFILGVFGKGLFIVKFYEPVYFLTGLSIWAFSFIVLFFGIFLVGWETVKMIQSRIRQHVKKTVSETYSYTRKLPKRSYDYTNKLRKKSARKIAKTSKLIVDKMKS